MRKMLINRRREGFTLVALLLGLLLAGLVLSSGAYIGKARKEKEVALTQRVGRDALLFLMIVNRQSALHNRIRSEVITEKGGSAGEILGLWTVSALEALVAEEEGFSTFTGYGKSEDGHDLVEKPEITSDIIHNEKVKTVGGDTVELPATISITLRVKTNFTMYGSVIRELRRSLLRSSYVTEVTFKAANGGDSYAINELFMSMLVGQKPGDGLLFGF